MKAKKPDSNLIPLVKTAELRKNDNSPIPNAIKNVIAYGLCKVCYQLLSARSSSWARNDLKCPNCKTVTHYYSNEWYRNKTPIVYDDQPFNVMDFMPKGVTPRGAKPEPTVTQIVNNDIDELGNRQQALFVLLQNIYAELQKLNDKWS